MQQAIERVECGNEEEKQKNSKSNPRYDDRNSDFFVEPLHPDQKTPDYYPFSLSKSILTPHPSYARGPHSFMP